MYSVKGFAAVCAIAVAGLFSSCSKDSGASASVTANVMIVNSTEGSAPQDFYSDSTKVDATAVAYGQGSGYLSTASGSHTGQFRNAGSTTVNASSSFVFSGGANYSVFYGSDASSNKFVATSQDDLTLPSAGKAKVRFVQLSSAAASSLDIALGDGTKVASALVFRSMSAYNNIDPTASFSLFATGTTTASLTIPASTLQAGKIYTILISGATTATVSYHVIAQN